MKVNTEPAKHIVYFFILASFISLLYSFIRGRYNGDFLGVKVTLSPETLTLNFILNILPFLFVWGLYKYYKSKRIKKRITIPVNFFFKFLLVLIIWNIAVTALYGVGIMGKLTYDAPSSIKPIIQIMNRFNYNYSSFVYILMVDKKNRKQFILIILLLILAYLRAGLGIFLYFGMVYYIKYFDEVKRFFSIKRIVITMLLLLSFPIILSSLYNLRDSLRGEKTISLVEDPMTGMFIGRLSSLSDSAFILQESNYFESEAQKLDPLYYIKQAVGGILSYDMIPKNRPEQMLIRFFYSNADGSVSYMAGTNGNFYIAFMKSPLVFLLNLIILVTFTLLIFKIFRLLRFYYAEELALILLLYVMLSGVANEISYLLFSIFVYVVLFLLINSFNKKLQ